MNKKERSIKALDAFIFQVKSNFPVSVGVTDDCNFCIIHLRDLKQTVKFDDVCKGCPFANRRGGSGCSIYDTYQELRYENPEDIDPYIISRVHQNLKAIRKVLISIPAERFTRKGWKYFEELKPLIFIK